MKPRAALLVCVSCVLLAAACSSPCSRSCVATPAPGAPPSAAPAPVQPAPGPVARAPEASSSPAWTAATPVGRIVADRPSAARVLEHAGIDYCCGGATPLAEAVCKKGGGDLELKALLEELSAVRATQPAATERVWAEASLREILDHIQTTHHAYLREELPRLTTIVEKVRDVHGSKHPELVEIATLYGQLARDLPAHLELEERRLFPAIASLEAGRDPRSPELLPALALMASEHDTAGAALHRLRELTKDYAVPADACAAYKQMLIGLAGLESDLHTHVHLENNVLAPRVRALTQG
jgi:regulator of cell morphogenesis and NO signaling